MTRPTRSFRERVEAEMQAMAEQAAREIERQARASAPWAGFDPGHYFYSGSEPIDVPFVVKENDPCPDSPESSATSASATSSGSSSGEPASEPPSTPTPLMIPPKGTSPG